MELVWNILEPSKCARTNGSQVGSDGGVQTVKRVDDGAGDSSSLLEVVNNSDAVVKGGGAGQSHGQSSPTENLEELHFDDLRDMNHLEKNCKRS